jgi:trigger factor
MAVVIGSGNLIPGFEDQLVGVKAGEEKTITVTFPKDYGAKNLAGQDATFDLRITAVKVPAEVELDDEFARQFRVESLEKLRELLKGNIEQEHGGLTRTFMKRQLLDRLAADHDFPVPPSMVEAEFGQIWSQLEHEATHEPDPDAARAEMEKDRDDYRAIAERRVRLGLLLSEIGQAHGVEVTAQEMNGLIAQAAQQYRPEDRQRFVEYIRSEPLAAAQLRAPLYEDKVVDYLFGTAEISERVVARADLEAAIESEEGMLHVHGPGCGHDHGHDHDHAHDHDHDHGQDHGAVEEPMKSAAAKKAAAKPAEASETAEAEAEDKPARKPAAKKPAAKKSTAEG